MRWLKLGILALVVFSAVAFTVQNEQRDAVLSLNLGVIAWKFRHPVSVPWLMWGSFGLGLGLAGVWGFGRAAILARRVRKLETDAALAGSRETGKDGWS